MDLLTLAECMDMLGVDGAADGAVVQTYIGTASDIIDAKCGPVVARSVTDHLDGGDGKVWVTTPPILTVTDVQEWDGTAATVLTEEQPFWFPVPIVPANGFLVDAAGTIRRRSSGSDAAFPSGRRNILVEYSAGRVAAVADVPDRFRQASFMIVDRLWRLYQATGTSTYGTDEWVPARAVPPMVNELLAADMLPVPVA